MHHRSAPLELALASRSHAASGHLLHGLLKPCTGRRRACSGGKLPKAQVLRITGANDACAAAMLGGRQSCSVLRGWNREVIGGAEVREGSDEALEVCVGSCEGVIFLLELLLRGLKCLHRDRL
jgi:hypothetical protein